MRVALLTMALIASPAIAPAAYRETMDPDGLAQNLKTRHGLADDHAKPDQIPILLKAVNEVAAAGDATPASWATKGPRG